MSLKVKRVYAPVSPGDGYRVLVDRLWPRGLSKERAGVDLWLKALAPGTELRKWFAHDPGKWVGFREKYFAELDTHPDEVEQLRKLARRRKVTLVHGARDEAHNDAVALVEYLGRSE